MRGREEVGFPIPRNNIPVVIKLSNSLTSDLDGLADDGNENHNYIVCLFIL